MFAGVLIRRAVAAQGYSAFLARSQMHPLCSDFYALTTLEMRWMFHLGDRGQMSTAFVSHKLHCLNTREQADRYVALAEGRDLMAKTGVAIVGMSNILPREIFGRRAEVARDLLRFALRSG